MGVRGRLLAGDLEMFVRGVGGGREKMLVGRRGRDVEQKMVPRAGFSLFLQQVMLGRGMFRLQKMMMGGGRLFAFEQFVLRRRVLALAERQRGIVIGLGRLGRFRPLGRGEPQRGGQAEHDGRERDEDGE